MASLRYDKRTYAYPASAKAISIYDETIDDARKKARRIVAEAEEHVNTLQEQSAQKMAEARADYDALKNASEEYRRNFTSLVEEQTRLLKENPIFN